MANSKYDYVKTFERDPVLLKECWPIVRLDGKGFTRFTELHKFEKPNDKRGLDLMNASAMAVMEDFQEIPIAYGQSDEFSFVFNKNTQLYGRRSFKFVSLVTSAFTGNYVRLWPTYFPETSIQSAPCFDGRVVEYPSIKQAKDYLAWRQVDAHINNQYNTCFWGLVKSGMGRTEAQQYLEGTNKETKNELLFQICGLNYNDELEQFKKGSVILWEEQRKEGGRLKRCPKVFHIDIIKEEFWTKHGSVFF